MSKRIMKNNEIGYSIVDVYTDFISKDGSRKGYIKFKKILVGLNLMEETVTSSGRKYTALSDWFSEVINGHYEVDGEGVRKGVKVKGPIYYDEYAIRMIKAFYHEALKEEVVQAYRVISKVSLKYIKELEAALDDM